ncbi:MAG: AAA family ATPase [Anaerolineae bacterium]|nr:AAA family ATPase [Anaerolineae bacterium]
MLYIHLLGHLQVYDGETAIEIRARPKTAPLWAYLLLHRDRPILRDNVAFALWPDDHEESARANLRRHLHQLNRTLPPAPPDVPWILSDYRTVQWNPDADYWLDVAAFERCERTEESLPEAVRFYTGDLLEDVYEDWLFYERERLRDRYFSALSRLAAIHRTRRDFPGALTYMQELLRRDPLREDAVRQLMSVKYEMGNRSGALAEYEQFARRLSAELNVEPMPETLALYEQIIHNAPIWGAPVAPRDPARKASARDILPFVGHETDMEQLRAWWNRAALGQGAMVFIGGEAGIGKTRLVAEFADLIGRQGGRTLYGATSFTEPIPYQAMVEALQSALPLLAALDIPPLWLSALSSILPGLRARLPDLKPPAALGAEQERERLFEAVWRCLSGLSRPRPVLLVLEDLHWASSGALALLEFLIRRASRYPLLIVVTYREEETPRMHPLRQMRRRLQEEQLAAHLTLNRLQPDTVEALIRRISGLDAEAAELSNYLYSRSDGNPLFIQELIHDWQETGQITAQGRRWRIHTLEKAAIPSRLHEVIAGRLGRLEKDSRALVEILAVIGPTFDVELLREVCGWDESAVLDTLNKLIDRRLIREVGGRGRFDYMFTHHLIRDEVYEQIPQETRRRRHRRIAQVMEELYPQRLAELSSGLAYHFALGGLDAPAAQYHLQAAEHALEMYAEDEALALAERGLAMADAPRLRWALLMLRESIHHRRGERERQRNDLAQLDQLAGLLADDALTCQLLLRRLGLQQVLGEREQETALIAEIKALVKRSGNAHFRVEILRAEATHAIHLGQYGTAQQLLEETLEQARTLGDRPVQVKCYCLLADIATHQGQFDAVAPFLERARALAEAQANHVLMARAMQSAAQAAFVQQAFETSQRFGAQALELCQQIGYRDGEAAAHKLLGAILGRLFAVSEARDHYRQAGELYAALGKKQGQAAVLLNMGILNVRLGRYAEGAEAFCQARPLFEALRDRRGLMLCEVNLSATLLFQGDYAAAQTVAQRSVTLARDLKSAHVEATALLNLGEAERGLDHWDDAVAYMEEGVALRRALGSQPADLGHDLCELTITYLRRGDLAAAQRTAGELLALFKADEAAMIEPQYILWAIAQTHRATGNTTEANELLQAAYERLQHKAQAIPDNTSREAFLRQSFNDEITTAYQSGLWPTHG